jgi:hypothetical protein
MAEEQDLSALFQAKKRKPKSEGETSTEGANAVKRKISLLSDETAAGVAEDSTAPLLDSTAKKKQTDMQSTGSKLDFAYDTNSAEPLGTSDATAETFQDTELDRDHRARREAALEHSKRLADAKELDTVYRGISHRQQFLIRKDTAKANAASDKNRVAGPVRAAANLRVTCRFDYRPDRCKDYAETGFCGFGDSCIFLHDRSEYKSSWQLDQEWDAAQKAKDLAHSNQDALVKDQNVSAVPKECSVCRNDLKQPVRTRCSHYFCEACVLKRKKCPQCNALLLGAFVPVAKQKPK